MADSIIELELQSKEQFVDAFSYKDALDAFLALLRELDTSFTQQAGKVGSSLKWYIHATHTSNPAVELLAESQLEDLDVSPKVIETALDSLDTLEKNPIRPFDLSYASLEKCQLLGDLIRRDNIGAVSIRAIGRQVTISERLDANVRQIMGQKIEVLGSVEGELDMITLRGRKYFNVYSLTSGKATRCYFGEAMKEQVRQALGHIVSIKGLIRSFRHEEGQEITEIAELQIIIDQQLPNAAEVRGIMPNLTGGKPSERYLKERWRAQP